LRRLQAYIGGIRCAIPPYDPRQDWLALRTPDIIDPARAIDGGGILPAGLTKTTSPAPP
jgi:hypothetical protein